MCVYIYVYIYIHMYMVASSSVFSLLNSVVLSWFFSLGENSILPAQCIYGSPVFRRLNIGYLHNHY